MRQDVHPLFPLKNVDFISKIPIDIGPFLVYIINIMRKHLFYTFLVFVYIWSWSIFNVLKADTRVETTVGHVISETIKGTDIDHSKILEQELSNLGHQFAIQMIGVLQSHLPYIMESVMTELKLELDKTQKCLLLKDSKIKDKDCE